MLTILLDNFLQTILVFIVIFLLSYNYISREPWRRLPPGPWNFPLVGSLPILGADLREPLPRLAQKYGDVLTVYLGPRRCIILNGYDVIKEALVKYGHVFSGRPPMFLFEELTHGFGIATKQGESCKKQRRVAQTVLKELGCRQNVMEIQIRKEAQSFLKLLDTTAGQPLVFYGLIQKAVANVIGSVVFGQRFDYADPTFKKYMEYVDDTAEKLANAAIINVLPFLRHLPGDLFSFKTWSKSNASMTSQYREMIHNRMTSLSHGDKPSDFVEAYLRVVEENPGTEFTEDQLLGVIVELYLAGTGTTSSTLTWMAAYLLHHPDVQDKICLEIDDVIGRERFPSMSDRPNMAYTEACFCELQRLADILPFSLPHGTTEDVWFRGYFIPKGSFILPNLNSVHMDPVLWPQPGKFDPTRFLDDDGKFAPRHELIPFSIGPRVCLGEGLARMELFLFVTSILQRFTFTLPPGHPLPNLKGKLGLIYNPQPFDVILQRR